MSRVIHWFRQDLRLADNPALVAAIAKGQVLPIYILDDENAGTYAMGGASRSWLHHSLKSLNKSLGDQLAVFSGNPVQVLTALISQYEIDTVHWNRCYEPWRIQRDTAIKSALQQQGITVESYNGSLLWEPWQIKKTDDTPYKVFTPFYRKGCLKAEPPRLPLSNPITNPQDQLIDARASTLSIDDLKLRPSINWDESLIAQWEIGEQGAQVRWQTFFEQGLAHYKEGRNLPAKPYVSKLSPYLHFGEISPNQLWYSVRQQGDTPSIDHFCSELGWREFSFSQLYFNPTLPEKNLQAKFDAFPWEERPDYLLAWQQGRTGIPMVDAGMRELWQTGHMHNRVRMIVGSFLVKNLRLHWHHGERWFWDTLFDADLASNSASWQWVAGCGADAAPYFRIFNPVTQGQKFDPNGEYVRKFVPELSNLSNKYLFNPWDAPLIERQLAGIQLGENYPEPIVDLKVSREAALSAFQSLKSNP